MLKWGGYNGPPTLSQGKSMYLVLKSTVAMGRRINAGDIVELPDDVARVLQAIGRVEATQAKASPVTVDRSVSLQTSDAPVVAKRGRPKRNAD